MSVVIRTSDRATFRRCRKQWDYSSKIRRNYEPVKTPTPLEFGIAFHEAMEVYYDPKGWESPLAVKASAALGAFAKAVNRQKEQYADSVGVLSDEMKVEFEERYELGIGMLNYYIFNYSAEYDMSWVPIAVEQHFELPIVDLDGNTIYVDGEPLVYQGRIDLIMYDGSTDTYWLVDHKTRAKFDSTDHYEQDTQASSYIWAAEQLYDIKLEGVIFNEIKKTVPKEPKVNKNGTLSVDKRQQTTAKLFRAKCEEVGQEPSKYQEYLDYLEDYGPEFVRRVITYRGKAAKRVQHQLIVDEAIDMASNPRIYPNPSDFNCRGCPFRTPCAAFLDDADEEYLLNDSTLFRKRED